jgi:hypothetical protein
MPISINMASVESIDFKNNKTLLTLKVSREEYKSFNGEKDMLVFPVASLDTTLVTGTLGNSNRIMLPNKVLRKNDIESLSKRVPSKVVKIKNGKYLIIQLEGPEDIPIFEPKT